MKVSIIIPFFNNAKEIKRTLTSVFKQTYQNFEVIIVNDASPDWKEGLFIINSFKENRIKIISHETNKNGAAARNTGIKAAQGEYIAFLDADDEWLPNHLEDSLAIIANENADISYCQAKVLNKVRSSLMPELGIIKPQTVSDYLFVQGAVMFTPTLVVKSMLAKEVRFNEKLRRHQDYDFLLRCEAVHVSFVFLNKPNVIVHWENNNPQAKGGTWDFSLQFALDYRKYFSKKAFSRFILKNCILPLIEDKNNTTAFKVFSKNINPTHLSKLNYYFVISYLLFGKFKHPWKWKK
ncbi:glycosyltransferase family 2 protein [Tamlana sp. 2_MG-2023]|uniref:glycosyltransferase family 2 protein n=1 Tax=unclassified Tamlana TaxID=2614803 RepID=UPI0026E2928C|nr:MULTISPECIES: glycosyltransferase family 2 protein [unclassified Tamlana]MDO6760246.1 glycosyltransferase family 2 protein [Tamlana sp. 2_MG-2023]MDO6790056.1 glycosyltransferase family 2 protein [Tamlana sp. 1_MG-2023]